MEKVEKLKMTKPQQSFLKKLNHYNAQVTRELAKKYPAKPRFESSESK